MGDLYRFPADRSATHRIDICDPGPSDQIDTGSRGMVPPHDLDAEAAVLSAVLLDGSALATVLEILKPEHFYSEANARIFQAIRELMTASTPVDIVSVAGWLRDREWTA